jgi:hypothetical protein
MGTVPDFRRPCENSGTVLFLPNAHMPMPPTPGHPQPQSTVLDRPIFLFLRPCETSSLFYFLSLQNGDSPQFRRFCETWALSYFCPTQDSRKSRPLQSATLVKMKLPGGNRAIVDIAKLRDYCLNPAHPRGRHKARLFASLLNLTQEDAEFLREHLLRAAREGNATPTLQDEFGQRYQIDSELTRGRHAIIRSAWIVLRGERIPKLTTCFVLLD